MIAKIGRGKSLFGVLSYNMNKVNNNTATVLAWKSPARAGLFFTQ